MGHRLGDVDFPAGIDFLHGKPLIRGFRVEGKSLPLDFNLKVLS